MSPDNPPGERAFSLPRREEHGPGCDYMHSYEVLSVLDDNAGPCKVCDKAMVRLLVNQHVNHNDYQYTMRLDFVYAHADGSAPHDGSITNCVKPKCPQCGRYGTVMHQMQAYGDARDCSACGWHDFYDIGD